MYENTIMKSIKNCSKGGIGGIRKNSRDTEFDQNTLLYACKEISP
jgi:hypothetical protein